ncbi:hypothetical protein EOE67_16320 [Rheinheimera riviphila]|uniref:Uncharacterized protein n=1 Tax=Rheinheimera riviphila TaxID=1834037 RepID=A0A437QGA8_9GAMM|nr:DUF6058 family natural product biosynthesis protein [Rheinheimera riviphila]RVU33581.1 hypothetical protein EOE67_16320 [Rheinheimera riviphila]
MQTHFVDKTTFALMVGITLDRLDQLILAKAIPSATYTCDGLSVASAVFGTTPINESITGEFFRPECVRWVQLAAQAPTGSERAAVLSQLTTELRISLAEHSSSNETIETKIEAYLPYFFNGTFGLCIADPSTGAGIVKKEMLQEKLIALTANGSIAAPVDASKQQKQQLSTLIDDYADSAMPFSPAEYERSSRKRLVDDLRQTLARA